MDLGSSLGKSHSHSSESGPGVLRNSSSNESLAGNDDDDIRFAGSKLPSAASAASTSSAYTDGAEQLAQERMAILAEANSRREAMAFDIFSSSPSELEKLTNANHAAAVMGRRALREALLEGENPHLQSNWDDGEGYYKVGPPKI
jgi:hypothetical protein